MRREFLEKMVRALPEADDPALRAQRAFIAKFLLERDPTLKAEILKELRQKSLKEGRAEGEKEILRHLVELKLGRALSPDEAYVLGDELRLKGSDAIVKLLLTEGTQTLEAWVRPPLGRSPQEAPIPSPSTEENRAPLPPPPRRKVRATFYIPSDLFEEARDATVHLAGPPLHLTLASLAEQGIRAELERLKKEHNGGKPFPRRQGDRKGGGTRGS
jgi:hypothetical protein